MPENKRRIMSVFSLAKRDHTFANVAWEPADVLRVRPGWSEEQAAEFLAVVETQIAAAALAGGWSAIIALLTEVEQRKGC